MIRPLFFEKSCLVIAITLIFCSFAVPASKRVELILDASGSMRGSLDNGEQKIKAAKSAVNQLVDELDDSVVLAFRAYGHQSPREQHDCEDTELLAPFQELAQNRENIKNHAAALQAQGYTPISLVLQQAAADFHSQDSGERVIILVSDGKETCEGDPCETARVLEEANAGLVIHTIGFGVDEATRQQLQCLSEVSGGQYFSADDTGELLGVLSAAFEAEAEETDEKEGTGYLKMPGAELGGHDIFDAESGEKVSSVSRSQTFVPLPAGIYNLEIGNTLWKSIHIEAGDTTLLQPAWITVKQAALAGHLVRNAETGEEVTFVSRMDDSATLLPGDYEVVFGNESDVIWPVSVGAGEEAVLEPGTVTVKSAYIGGHDIYDSNGTLVGEVSATMNWMPLPPGEYTIEIDDEKFTFELSKGEDKVFER
ncbi:VWA domain-containing protein [candidate division KSB1 bacterium]|nr:VWA domain-containing protein [candidate division KSB1 bacterium]